MEKKQLEQFKALLKSSASDNIAVATESQSMITKAIKLPVREAILSGDIIMKHGIYETMVLDPEAAPEFPLDLIGIGDEDDFVAFTNPGDGYIPQKQIEGGFVMVPTYSIAGSIDWLLKFARLGRIDIFSRAMQLLNHQFTKKINDDGWHTIITAATDRNILVYDGDATAGQFTKRLVSLAKTVMRRNGGGNSSSVNRGRLTDLFMSPEGIEDIRNWGLDQIDEVTRREFFKAADGTINTMFGVRLHDLDEFGVGQEYQLFFEEVLGAQVHTNDTEMALGLDLANTGSFVMPIKQELEIFDDPMLHRYQKAGMYGWMDAGFASLDNRRTMLLSY